MIHARINNLKFSAISVASPTKKVAVESFYDIFGKEDVDSFTEMTGVESFYRADYNQTAGDLGFIAANDAITKTNIDLNDIGILVFVTQKPDHRLPSTAFLLQKRLGLSTDCLCFDLNLACSGFIFGLHSIMSILKSSNSKAALLVTGDTSHRTLSPSDRTMIMLFGDSGTATLIEKDESSSPSYFAFRTDGKRFKSIITPSGAFRNIGAPKERIPWGDGIVRSDYDTHMKGMDVFGFSITDVPKLMKELMSELGSSPDTYDYFALHQANKFILQRISAKLKIPWEKIPLALDRFGNNSSNSIPLALADRFGSEKDKKIRTFMSGFGAGLSWGCCDITLGTEAIHPIIFSDEYYRDG